MKFRWRIFISGILVGSVGPLAVLLKTTTVHLFGYDFYLLWLFPLCLALMMTEFFPPFLSAVFFICLSLFNIGIFGGFGYFLGLTIEAVKAENTFKKKVRVGVGYLLLSFFVFVLLFGCGLSFTFVVQEFLINGKWLKGSGYFLIMTALFIGIISLFKVFSRKTKFERNPLR